MQHRSGDTRGGLIVLMLLAASLAVGQACSREQPQKTTTLVPPAAPRPAPPGGSETVGRQPLITTSGSPVPGGVEHVQFDPVTLRDDSIVAPPLLPRGAAVFRVTNAGTIAHNLLIDGRTTHAQIEKPLAPGENLILQMTLRDASYTLRCSLPGHHEQTTLRTYAPH